MDETILDWQPNTLEDELVNLIPLTDADFEILFHVASDPLLWEQHPSKNRFKKDIFQLFFDGAVNSRTAFLVKDRISNKIIGSTRYYDYQPEHSSIAIGYTFLARQYWGGRYNNAIKRIMLNYAFRFIDKVYFHVATQNIRSQLAVTKIGARKLRKVDFEHYGEYVKHYEYLIDKRDWI